MAQSETLLLSLARLDTLQAQVEAIRNSIPRVLEPFGLSRIGDSDDASQLGRPLGSLHNNGNDGRKAEVLKRFREVSREVESGLESVRRGVESHAG